MNKRQNYFKFDENYKPTGSKSVTSNMRHKSTLQSNHLKPAIKRKSFFKKEA